MAAIKLLAYAPQGMALGEIAEQLDLPKSGVFRLLADLVRLGLVRQDTAGGSYFLTMGLVSLAFQHLAHIGVVDAAQPVLDRLAAESAELVRLGIIDGDRQVWVAKAQGARSGLIYDAQMGDVAQLSCMASGHAWLAQLDEAEAVRLVMQQGLAGEGQYGPNAPRTVSELIAVLAETRQRGYALVVESSAPGMSAIAAPVYHPTSGLVVGTVSIGGPSVRLSRDRLESLSGFLLAAAAELSDLCAGSPYLMSAHPSAAVPESNPR